MAAPALDRCPDENLLVSLIEGRLGEADVRALEDHLDGCVSCDALFGELAAVISPEPDPSRRVGGDFKIGRYRVLGEVGAGAMGVVFAAHDPDLDRKVALKLLRPDVAVGAYHAAARARLLREARLLAGLNHPNVLSVYEAGVAGDQVFIAIELILGKSLDVWQEKARPWTRVVEVYTQAARGLAAAHRAGLVHRDVKPANLMVGDDGRVRVTDFGLATARDAEASGARPSSRADTALMTQSGAIVGTPAYMAPEQLAGRRVDARSDQFSFALALGEALVGERPIAGSTIEDLEEARVAHRRSEVPVALFEIVARGLRARAPDRFADMEELVAALERLGSSDELSSASSSQASQTPPAALPSAPEGRVSSERAPEARTTPPAAPTAPPPRAERASPGSVRAGRSSRLVWGVVAAAALGGAWLVGRSSVVRPSAVAPTDPSARVEAATAAHAASSEVSSAAPSVTVIEASSSIAAPDAPKTEPSARAATSPPNVAPTSSTSTASTAGTSMRGASTSAPTPTGPVAVSMSDDERSMVIGIERAHDVGEAADCLKRLGELRKTNPSLASRADLVMDDAQCTQMAGDCASGRKKLAGHLARSYAGAELDAAVDAASISKCRAAKPLDPQSPELAAKREAVQKLVAEATAARTAKDVEKCRAVGAEVDALVAREKLASEPRLKALAFGASSTVVMCLADSGDPKSCNAAGAAWRQQYRSLYPELVANGLDDAALAKMFHESFPRCP